MGEIKTPRKVHVVTMSKGGVGKSLVSLNLVQYLRDRDRSVVAVDLDPMTHTLAEWTGLGVRVVDLLLKDDASVNSTAMDGLSEDILVKNTGSDFVLDNGAAGFVGLTRYLADNAFSGMLGDGHLVVHAVLGGGSASVQCLVGLNTLLEAFAGDPGVRFVLWVNEHAGPFLVEGMPLEDMAVYKRAVENGLVLGVVRLPRLSKAFLDDFDRMREMRLTYAEAIGSPAFFVMNKQRLKIIRDGVWAQLDGIDL